MKILTLLLLLGVVTSTQIHAQTSPGGVGPTNTSFWYKFNELDLADGANIGSITDFSGNGLTLTPSTHATGGPTFEINELNGLAIGRFTTDRMTGAPSTFPSSAITTFVVFKTNAGGDALVSYNGTGDNQYLLFDPTSLRYYVNGDNIISGANFRTPANTWDIVSHRWDNAIGSDMHRNGTLVSTTAGHQGAATIPIGGSSLLALGGELDNLDDGNSEGQEFEGDMAEVIIFNKALNDAERTIVENYLSAKYNLTTATDLYAGDTGPNGEFDFGIIGIGSEATGTHLLAEGEGLTLTSNTGLDVGDYLMAGHLNGANTVNTTDLAAGATTLEERWERVWYLDETNAGTALTVDIAFNGNNYGLGGINVGNAADYRLLFRAGIADAWTDLGAATAVDDANNSITFGNVALTADGYYTIGTTDATASPLSKAASQTWYSFSTGNWNNPLNWTLDPSTAPLYTNPVNEIPGDEDSVVINSGRTISLDIDDIVVQSVEINGIIDLLDADNTDFSIIRGNGIIRMDGLSGVDNFPAGSVTGSGNFSDAVDGGILVIYGSGITLNQNRAFNNVRIETNSSADKTTLSADYIINGDFRIEQGDFEFDGNANRELTVRGDATILSNGSLNVASANFRHQFNLYGDFLNLGVANFTNRTAGGFTSTNPNDAYYSTDATDGIIDFNLLSATQNQTVDCNNTTNFYRIEIDKGSDDTYIAYIRTTQQSFFNLLGTANDNMDNNIINTDEVSFNDNALGLVTGTVVIESNVVIPVLNRSTNYCIGSNGRLWIDGGTVRKTSSTAIVPYGTLEISDGILEATGNSGITLRINGLIKVDGGIITTNNIRTSVQGTQSVGGYVQTGGDVTVDAGLGGANGDYYVFSLTYSGNVFSMSGGTLTVRGGTTKSLNGTTGFEHGGGVFINSDPGNQNVTGGTVILESSLNREFILTSRAPFYNVIVRNSFNGATPKIAVEGGTSGDDGFGGNGTNNGGTGDDEFVTLGAQNLKVLNDLTIETGTTRTQTLDGRANLYGGYLDLCPNNTDCANLEVGSDLTIEDSGVLDVWAWDGTDNDGSSIVTFNSSANGIFYIGDITTYSNSLLQYLEPANGGVASFGGRREIVGLWEFPMYDWVIDKPNATLFLSAKLPGKGQTPAASAPSRYKNSTNGGKNVTRFGSNLVKVLNKMIILDGTLNQVDPNNTVTIVEDDGGVYGSVGDPVGYSVRLAGTEVINNGNFFVYEDGVTPKEGIIVLRKDAGNVTLQTTDGATFGNFRLLIAPNTVTVTSDIEVKRLEVVDGKLDIGTHNLKVDVFEMRVGNATPSVGGGQEVFTSDHYIRMAGNASDGGLSVKVPRSVSAIPDLDEFENLNNASRQNNNQEYNQTNRIWFPIGTNASGADKYTPAIVHLHSIGTITGDEYITVRVVDSELQTTELTGGDILSYYWRVGFEGYATGEEPTVSWLFQYDDADIDGGAEVDYVPGKVLDGGTYLRSDEGGINAVKHGGTAGLEGALLGNNPRNVVIFNGVGTDAAPVGADNIEGVNQALYNNAPINGGWAAAWANAGFTLETANYTAGVPARFVGAPEVFYLRTRNNANNNFWDDGDHWSTTRGGGGAGDYPQAGDVAILQLQNNLGDTRSNIVVDRAEECAVVRFDEPTISSGGYPRIEFSNSNSFAGYNSQFGIIDRTDEDMGRAIILLRLSDGYTQQFPTGDLNDVLTDPGALVLIEWNGSENQTTTLPSLTSYPSLIFEFNNNRTNNTFLFPDDVNVSVANNVSIRQRHKVILGSGSNFSITRNLTLGGSGGFRQGSLFYPGGSTGSTSLKVGSTLTVRTPTGAGGTSLLGINDPTSGVQTHRLIAKGNIVISDTDGGDIDLGTGDPSETNVILEFGGTGTNTLLGSNGTTSTVTVPQLVMNKGTDITNTFTISSPVTLSTLSVLQDQPIEILNGLLVVDEPTFDVTLTDATRGNFLLPNTNNILASSGSGGLEIRQGTARINGSNAGIILDGLLRISGGTLDMTDGANNGNNFIEYSSSNQAILEVSAGSLIVGSQVRRSNFAQTGILKYRQTGGTVSIGRNDFPKVSNRGVFEILNTGSEFTHTAGSFTIEKDNGSASVASLWLEPETFNFGSATTLTLGANSTPASTNFGVRVIEYINNLTLDNVSTSNPKATLFTIPLSLDGELLIDNNSTFDANGRGLNFRGNNVADGGSVLENNGIFNANQNLTTFSVTDTKQITGTSNIFFYDFTTNGNGTLELTIDGGADNDVRILAGTFATGTHKFTVLGDVFHDAVHTSANVGAGVEHGIIMANTSTRQTIQRTSIGASTFGALVIKNANDVRIIDSDYEFFFTEKLMLSAGKFDIGGNLITFLTSATDIENGTGATAITDFSINNMIQTNSSIKDFGVKRFFPDGANVAKDYVYPVGQLDYTPVQINSQGLTSASGFFLVRPVNDKPLGILEDFEQNPTAGGPCPGDTEINDFDNVLNYYWIIKSGGITDFNTSGASKDGINCFYDVVDLPTAINGAYSIDNMGSAKLLNASSNWDKTPLFEDDFDETNQQITFHFTGTNMSSDVMGIYTAGVILENTGLTELCGGGAIPTTVQLYTTIGIGSNIFENTTTNDTWINATIPINGPLGSDILVKSGFILDLSNVGIDVRQRKTTIEAGATIRIRDTDNHNLGFVDGEGTIELMSSGLDAKLPAGDYEEFFPTATDCSKKGSLTYSGTGTYSVMNELSAVYNINFIEQGERNLPNKNFLVCNDMTFDQDGGTLIVENQFDTNIEVKGDIIRFDGEFKSGSGTATISLTGTDLQSITGAFTDASSADFNNLTFNNSAGFTVVNAGNDDVEVKRTITLINGVVTTDANNSFTLKENGTITGGSNATHINGPFRRILSDFNQTYRMPLGDRTYYGQLDIVNPDNYVGTKTWEGEYYRETPQDPYLLNPAIIASGYDRTTLAEYWRVNDGLSGGSPSAKIRPYYTGTSDVVSTSDLKLVVDVNPFVTFRWDALEVESIVGSGANGYATSVPLGFSERFITFATTDSTTTPLPVTLISFEGFQNEEVIELQWATAIEINNSHFIIEKLGGDNSFSEIGRVEGNGDSKLRINYQSFDTEPIVGINYYRLKQVDFDGGFAYSRVIEVRFFRDGNSVTIPLSMTLYPNPVNNQELNIRLQGFVNSEKTQVQIFDLMGREVFNSSMKIKRQFLVEKAFTIPTLPTGIYIVKVADGKESLAKRIMVK